MFLKFKAGPGGDLQDHRLLEQATHLDALAHGGGKAPLEDDLADDLVFRRYDRFGAGGAKLIWGEATAVVEEGRARSRDEWVEGALRRELATLRRSALDAEFRHMADDVEYQRDVRQILGEFARADGEALQEEQGQGTDVRRI